MKTTSKDVKDIFVNLIRNVPPQEWETRLEQAADGDDALLRRVKDLLRAHVKTGSFLDEPAVAANVTIDLEVESAGSTIGPYTLLEPIGEGGMGTVYIAEQARPVRRKVALKVIKAGMESKPGHRPLRGRAAGPGPDGSPEHRPGARCRRHRLRPPLLRHGAGRGHPDHRLLRPRSGSPSASGWSCSSRSATPCSTPTRRGSSIAT